MVNTQRASGHPKVSRGEANTSCGANTKVKSTWMYPLSFAAWRHQFRGFWKDAQRHPFPIWLVKWSGGGGKHSATQAALRSTGVLCTWHNAPSPQETQLLQSTAVCVLNNSNIHVHVKLIPALCTGFPCSDSRSQSLFPCCSVAWPENCRWHTLGCWVKLTVPEALGTFLAPG